MRELRSVWWEKNQLVTVDSTKLPRTLTYLRLRKYRDVCGAIKGMKVRGAPLIGVAGAYGMALAAFEAEKLPARSLERFLKKASQDLIATRPTGANLKWAVERVLRRLLSTDGKSIGAEALKEASLIHEGDLESSRRIGDYGAGLIQDGDCILTHCNAGTLATAGYGTALGVVRSAAKTRNGISVLATETRPLLQGARLTAFELKHDGIPVRIIADSAAPFLISKGMVQKVVVGADRILHTGHVANKIGTLPIALACSRYGVPLYVAAPMSTMDLETTPSDLPVEERDPDEVLELEGRPLAPRGVAALNPAFDVTPPDLVSGIITDLGVALAPVEANLLILLKKVS